MSAGGKSAGGAGGGGILKNDVKRMAEALSKREMVECPHKWLACALRLNRSCWVSTLLVPRTDKMVLAFEMTKHMHAQERDEARSQLHTALSLLERASQLTGAINSVSSSAAVAESSELTTSHRLSNCRVRKILRTERLLGCIKRALSLHVYMCVHAWART